VLVELVAKCGIAQEIGEIVEEVELAFDREGIRLPRSGIVRAGHPSR
jgi:hypothetical protein